MNAIHSNFRNSDNAHKEVQQQTLDIDPVSQSALTTYDVHQLLADSPQLTWVAQVGYFGLHIYKCKVYGYA